MKRIAAFVAIVLAAGCAQASQQAGRSDATAELKDASGKSVGTARIAETSRGVRVVVDVKGLTEGPVGVHIHEVGSCEPPDFESAGAHFNPEGKQHGLQNPQGPHAGDLPNLKVAGKGEGQVQATNNRITLGEGSNSIFDADGSALVVHAKQDDQKTDPSGESGDRIACGVIEKG
jgi:Cu-Zn family superoxide dismutase